MSNKTNNGRWAEMAKAMIREVSKDSSFSIYGEDGEDEAYPADDVLRIAEASEEFFRANPEFETPYDIHQICCGEYTENEERYGSLVGWEKLKDAVNIYFDGEE